jgi:predicted anti-sigma-YlaC factor YlaD
MNTVNDNEESRQGVWPMKCEDIQSMLFDYMARELGSARSDLVREHLRKCEACQREAADVQQTLDMLQKAASEEAGAVPSRLSASRRKRMRLALFHPVLDWIYRHHVAVSLVVAALVIVAALAILRKVRIEADRPVPGPVVIIGQPPTNAANGTRLPE